MLKDEVKAKLRHEPFVPLEVRTADGRRLEVPFAHVAVVMSDGLMVFHGIKNERSRVATGYDFISFDGVKDIEPRTAGANGLPKTNRE